MSGEIDRPLYEDEFEKYTMAVAMLGILFREGLLTKEVYEKIKTEHEKELEKYLDMC